jgi:hypothetical protein
MIQNAKDLHVVVGKKKDGSTAQYIGDEAGAASRFESWSAGLDVSDLDGDGDKLEPNLSFLLWYGKGRLIKYKNLN